MPNALSSLALAALVGASPAFGGEIDLRITGFPNDAGAARIVLMEGEAGYLGEVPVTLTASVPIDAGEARWQAEVAPGTYAIIAHHDADANDELDRPVFALPLEPYGYSNGAWTSFGLPAFEAVAFEVGDGVVRQSVHLRMNAFAVALQVAAVGLPALAVIFGGLALVRLRRRRQAA